MSSLKEQVKQLRSTIFNMLNFTNIYVLILNQKLEIKFANMSLANDLGFDSYKELLGYYWLDFIEEKEINITNTLNTAISSEYENWQEKYREFQNNIKSKNGNIISVYWFNSHINNNYDCIFSFGIKKQTTKDITIDSLRNYYQDIISKDRIMINSMREVIGLKRKL